jgi:hypothetical protein
LEFYDSYQSTWIGLLWHTHRLMDK